MSNYNAFLKSKNDLLTDDIIEKIEIDNPLVVEIFERKKFEIEIANSEEKKKEILLFLEKGIETLNNQLYSFYNQPNLKSITNGYDSSLVSVHFLNLYKKEYERLKLNILNFPNPTIKEHLIDYSETNLKEKIIALKELGIIDYLQKEYIICQTSTNKLAEILSLLTGEKSKTIQSYLNPMISKETSQTNNPYNNPKTVDKTKNKLITIGVFKAK